VFAGHSAARETSGEFPTEIKVVERLPTAQELITLARSVGWSDFFPLDRVDKHVAAPAFGVVAIDTITGRTIGCALLLTDHASFYYIKDVIVDPAWQKRRIGTALMNALMLWLDRNAVPKSLVGLYTGENLEPFYRQFGFSNAFGMCKRM
jgi:GNAT superfamily N-acetyltransferase